MVDLQIFTSLISPIIVIACLIVGYIIKNAVPSKIINKWIPLILAAMGIGLNCWFLGIFDFNTVMTGAASGLASTGLYESFRNILEFGDETFSGKHLK